jgi:glycosyltransferase involved in cell wall biosynthesis
MTPHLGHYTYGQLMREYFYNYTSNNIDFYWFTEELELLVQILCKPLYFSFPNLWIQERNLDYYRLRSETASSYKARRLISRKFRKNNYSVMHLHTQVMGLLVIDYMKKVPTVIGIDFTTALASKEMPYTDFQWTYAPSILLEKQVFNFASKIITWSDFVRKSVIEDYQIDEKKVKTIPPGVNTSIFKKPKELTAFREERFKILFIGGQFSRKGGDDLLEVFLANFSDIAELYLVTQTSINCQHPHVHVFSDVKVYTSEWLKLYQQADAFVMPSYSEALGLVYIEAMAAGLPVIASRLPQTCEVIIDGETGYLVQPGDRYDLVCKIRALIENPHLRQQMGLKGRLIAERKFNAQINFQSLDSIFREVSAP